MSTCPLSENMQSSSPYPNPTNQHLRELPSSHPAPMPGCKDAREAHSSIPQLISLGRGYATWLLSAQIHHLSASCVAHQDSHRYEPGKATSPYYVVSAVNFSSAFGRVFPNGLINLIRCLYFPNNYISQLASYLQGRLEACPHRLRKVVIALCLFHHYVSDYPQLTLLISSYDDDFIASS